MRWLAGCGCGLLLGCGVLTDNASNNPNDGAPVTPQTHFSWPEAPIAISPSLDPCLPGIWTTADASDSSMLRVLPFNSAGEYLLELSENRAPAVVQMRGVIVRAGSQSYLIANRLDFDLASVQFNVMKISYPDDMTLDLAWMAPDAIPSSVASSTDSLARFLTTNDVPTTAFPSHGIMKLTWLTGPWFQGAPRRTSPSRN
jgi:hypothetical protein